MVIAFSTAALFPRPTLTALELIQACGFPFAELMPQCRHETRPSFAIMFARKKFRVEIWSVHFPLVFSPIFYNPYNTMQQEAAILIKDIVRMSAALGAKIIVIHPPNDMPEDLKRLFERPIIQNIRRLCDNAAEHGIAIAIENSPSSQCKSPTGMLKFLSTLEHENAYPMLDTTEAVEAGYDPVDFLQTIDPIHLHVSDHSATAQHLPVGEGLIEWEKFFRVLRAKHYSKGLVVEPAYRYFLSYKKEKEIIQKIQKMKYFIINIWEKIL
ncbi:MAG: sugar phosphate isomerase/epimerase family protein [Candidatus Bathyarchaeia archaeon]